MEDMGRTIVFSTPSMNPWNISVSFRCHSKPSRFHFAIQLGRRFIAGKISTRNAPGSAACTSRCMRSFIRSTRASLDLSIGGQA